MKLIKWGVIAIGVLVVLLVAAVLIVPRVVDVQKFKPRIEKMAFEATGRPLTLGGEMKLSLFPWVGVSLADVQLGNPGGFTDKNMLTVTSFEVSVKLLPLLSRDIQVKKLLLDGARLSLEKLENGRGNWEGIGRSDHKELVQEKKEGAGESGAGLPISSLAVGEIAITNGKIIWQDHAAGVKKEISAINLRMRDVSLDNPVQLAFSADVDGQPMSVQGKAGPLGRAPGKGTIPLDFVLKAMNQLKVSVKGKVVDPLSKQKFDLDLDLAAFSPRKLAAALGRDFPVRTADPQALSRLGLRARIIGTPTDIAIDKGSLNLDDSHMIFSAHLSEFSRPNIQCDLELDRIDVDLYLPPAGGKTAGQKKPSGVSAAGKKKIDYTPLRKLLLDGNLKAGEVKVHGVVMQDIVLKITGRKGKFQFDPFSVNLYQGSLHSTGTFNCRQDVPVSALNLQLKDIQVGPLLKDSIDKDFLVGTLASRMELTMTGDEPEQIKRSLNGKGILSLKDGAIIGVDLASMARNIKSGLQLNRKTSEKPRTDFAELTAPFAIVNGIVDTPGTTMKSPFLRLSAVGKADVPRQSLDFRIKPKIVKTLKGQGDTKQRSGLVVPLLVNGTFSAPKIQPDLQGVIGKDIPDARELKKMLSDDGASKEKVKSMKKNLKGLLKGFSPGK